MAPAFVDCPVAQAFSLNRFIPQGRSHRLQGADPYSNRTTDGTFRRPVLSALLNYTKIVLAEVPNRDQSLEVNMLFVARHDIRFDYNDWRVETDLCDFFNRPSEIHVALMKYA